jgi:hypothetical protein
MKSHSKVKKSSPHLEKRRKKFLIASRNIHAARKEKKNDAIAANVYAAATHTNIA